MTKYQLQDWQTHTLIEVGAIATNVLEFNSPIEVVARLRAIAGDLEQYFSEPEAEAIDPESVAQTPLNLENWMSIKGMGFEGVLDALGSHVAALEIAATHLNASAEWLLEEGRVRYQKMPAEELGKLLSRIMHVMFQQFDPIPEDSEADNGGDRHLSVVEPDWAKEEDLKPLDLR